MNLLRHAEALLLCLFATTACSASSGPSDLFPSRFVSAVVRGAVVDEDGAAVAGAQVSAVVAESFAPSTCSSYSITVDTVTNQSGEYRFAIRSGGPQYDACVTVTATPSAETKLQPATAPVGRVRFTSEFGDAVPEELVVNVTVHP